MKIKIFIFLWILFISFDNSTVSTSKVEKIKIEKGNKELKNFEKNKSTIEGLIEKFGDLINVEKKEKREAEKQAAELRKKWEELGISLNGKLKEGKVEKDEDFQKAVNHFGEFQQQFLSVKKVKNIYSLNDNVYDAWIKTVGDHLTSLFDFMPIHSDRVIKENDQVSKWEVDDDNTWKKNLWGKETIEKMEELFDDVSSAEGPDSKNLSSKGPSKLDKLDDFIVYLNQHICGETMLAELKDKKERFGGLILAKGDDKPKFITIGTERAQEDFTMSSNAAIEGLLKFRENADKILIEIVLLLKNYSFNSAKDFESLKENFEKLAERGANKYYAVENDFEIFKNGLIKKFGDEFGIILKCYQIFKSVGFNENAGKKEREKKKKEIEGFDKGLYKTCRNKFAKLPAEFDIKNIKKFEKKGLETDLEKLKELSEYRFV
ncbi:unnamed protein product [Meloidogyne enterolobii]|uniref:Uncharacterized protein n=2 Tax=Meloidogyne enterolobii TaxID=390850 RepID=A0ACB1A632_MELEN|nr:unnamed protein product [Meloidogyne enterolobii]